MAKFSQTSRNKLNTCHRDLQVLFEHVIVEYDCTIVCGHRGELAQNQAFADGNSEKQWPNSKHNKLPSKAADVAPYEKSGIDWGKTQSAYFAGVVNGIAIRLLAEGKISHKIRCGIDWDQDNDVDDTKFWDACHFEIVDKKIV